MIETYTLYMQRPLSTRKHFQVEGLVLDFKGRHILSSAKNFQLALLVAESASGYSTSLVVHTDLLFVS